VGEQSACGALYAILEPLPALGNVSPWAIIGPTSPQLALALSAGAAGLHDRAPSHFEEAERLAATLPDRLLSPRSRCGSAAISPAGAVMVARGERRCWRMRRPISRSLECHCIASERFAGERKLVKRLLDNASDEDCSGRRLGLLLLFFSRPGE